MQFELSDKQQTDSQDFNYAYLYDSRGYYQGMVQRQKDPMNPGQDLIPANATLKRPFFYEGFKPRFNIISQSWDLISEHTKTLDTDQLKFDYSEEYYNETLKQLHMTLKQILRNDFDNFVARTNVTIIEYYKTLDAKYSDFSKLVDQKSQHFFSETSQFQTNISSLQEQIKNVVKNNTDFQLTSIDERMRIDERFFMLRCELETLKKNLKLTLWEKIKSIFYNR